MLNAIISKLYYLLNIILPKFKNKTVFCCFPDFEDMLRGMLPHINGRIIVLVTNTDVIRPNWLDEKIEVVKKKSISGLWHLLTARTIYFTHGLFFFFRLISSDRQLVVNLWHGMPLKNIGFLDGKKHVPPSHKLLCTSLMFQRIMAEAFRMQLDDVLITGLPRNDVLLRRVENKELIKLNKKYKKIHVWLPTYRKSYLGDIRNDGNASNVFGFADFDAKGLNQLLKSNNEFLLVKPHPMAMYTDSAESLSNIKIINEQWLSGVGITLYELLAATDTLWTDFSSVFVDYAITKKTILFVIPDMKLYKESRGLTFDIETIKLPGLVVENEKDLISAVANQGDWGNETQCSDFNAISPFNFSALSK